MVIRQKIAKDAKMDGKTRKKRDVSTKMNARRAMFVNQTNTARILKAVLNAKVYWCIPSAGNHILLRVGSFQFDLCTRVI